MGDRGNIVVTHPGGQRIFLYTHWGGRRLEEAVRDALRQGRWVDGAYLTRNLYEALRGADDDPLGYGIAPARTWPDRDEWHVDVAAGTVTRVTLDHVLSEAEVALFERPVERWTFRAFLARAPGVPLPDAPAFDEMIPP